MPVLTEQGLAESPGQLVAARQNRHYQVLVLGSAITLGAIFRILPIPYGLPFFYHPDETHLIFNFGKFLEGMARGSFSMDTSTFYYPLAVLYGGYFLYGRMTGQFMSLDDFKQAFLLDDPALHLLGRVVSVAFSLVAVWLTYVLGRRVYEKQAGVIAAVLMAFSLLDISSSHWLKLDSTVTCMTLLSILTMLRITDQSGMRVSLLAGLAVGVAMATRLDAFVLLPLLALVHLLRAQGQACSRGWKNCFDGRLSTSLGVAVFTYLVVSFRLVEFVSKGLLGHAPLFKTRPVAASVIEYFLVGDVFVSLLHNARFYLVDSLIGTGGVALTAAVVWGVISAIRSRRLEEITIIAFLTLSLIPLLTFTAYGTHYMLSLAPYLMILAAGAVTTLAKWADTRTGIRPALGWVMVLTVVVLAQPTFLSATYVAYVYKHIDTRTQAREWIYHNIPVGEGIAVQKYYELPRFLPALYETRDQLETKLAIVRADGRGSGLAFDALLANYPSHTYRIVNLSIEPHWNAPGSYLENAYDYDQLLEHGVRYVVTSGRNNPLPINEDGSPVGVLIAPRFFDQEALRRYKAFMRMLHERGQLLAEFAPADLQIALRTDSPIDPTIRIYRLERKVMSGGPSAESVSQDT